VEHNVDAEDAKTFACTVRSAPCGGGLANERVGGTFRGARGLVAKEAGEDAEETHRDSAESKRRSTNARAPHLAKHSPPPRRFRAGHADAAPVEAVHIEE
jgi:hypothetical protein